MEAKEKMKEAIAILNADPEYYGYDATKDITIIFGSSTDSDKQRFRCDYLQGVVNTLTEAHGSSDARAFYNAVRQAVDAANNNTAEELEIALKQISTAKEKA